MIHGRPPTRNYFTVRTSAECRAAIERLALARGTTPAELARELLEGAAAALELSSLPAQQRGRPAA
jgi:hypothetical protein